MSFVYQLISDAQDFDSFYRIIRNGSIEFEDYELIEIRVGNKLAKLNDEGGYDLFELSDEQTIDYAVIRPFKRFRLELDDSSLGILSDYELRKTFFGVNYVKDGESIEVSKNNIVKFSLNDHTPIKVDDFLRTHLWVKPETEVIKNLIKNGYNPTGSFDNSSVRKLNFYESTAIAPDSVYNSLKMDYKFNELYDEAFKEANEVFDEIENAIAELKNKYSAIEGFESDPNYQGELDNLKEYFSKEYEWYDLSLNFNEEVSNLSQLEREIIIQERLSQLEERIKTEKLTDFDQDEINNGFKRICESFAEFKENHESINRKYKKDYNKLIESLNDKYEWFSIVLESVEEYLANKSLNESVIYEQFHQENKNLSNFLNEQQGTLVEPKEEHVLNSIGEIIYLPNLEELDLSNQRVKELPGDIKLLKKLKILNLSGNGEVIIPETFKDLVLDELIIDEELAPTIAASTNPLTKVYVKTNLDLENTFYDLLLPLAEYNFLKNIEPTNGFNKRSLNQEDPIVNISLRWLSGKTNIEKLEIVNYPIDHLDGVYEFKKLKSLSLINCGLSSASFINDLNIYYLNLSNNNLAGSFSLDNLNKLKVLILDNNNLDHLIYNQLINPEDNKLKRVSLKNNNFNGFNEEELNLLHNVEFLYLDDNPFSIDCLINLTNMESLSLNNCNISVLTEKIVYLKKLKYLYLNNNHLESIPEALINIDLENIELKNNSIVHLPPLIIYKYEFKINVEGNHLDQVTKDRLTTSMGIAHHNFNEIIKLFSKKLGDDKDPKKVS